MAGVVNGLFSRSVRTLAACIVVLAGVAGSTWSGSARQRAASVPQPPAGTGHEQVPGFRADANLVRLDVYASRAGMPVTDLAAADFEVLEDGAPQKIESFERVEMSPRAAVPRAPASLNGDRADETTGRSRVFVLFLDSYFTDVAGSERVRRGLVDFLDRLVGPDDLIGIVTPGMAPSDLTLAHRTGSAEDLLSRHWEWGHRGATALDPIEQEYMVCYPPHAYQDRTGQEMFPNVAEEMIERRREKAVLDSLTGLTKSLAGVSDGRKAVIIVTDGWVLFRPNFALTERGTDRAGHAGAGRDGKVTADTTRENGGVSTERCEHDRVTLALVDDKSTFDALASTANRGNVSFYPLSADGLRLHAPQEIGELHLLAGEDAERRRADALHSLAAQTDGIAVTGTNNLDATLTRIHDDLSSYYLLGYYSSNQSLDGKFRTIEVRLKRPGVDVRARPGYRAPTVEDVQRATTSTQSGATKKSPLQAVLADLKADHPNAPIHLGAAYASLPGGDAEGARAHVWALAEIDPDLARHGEWIGGGTVELTLSASGGETLGSKTVTLAGGERAVSADFGEVLVGKGDAVLHATAKASGGGRQNFAEALHLSSLATGGRPLVSRRGPGSAMRYLPTADHDFTRTERVRLDLPWMTAVASPSAVLMDRDGRPMTIPVTVTTRVEGSITWVTAEVSLAPLATGTYVVRIQPDGGNPATQVLAGFRVVP